MKSYRELIVWQKSIHLVTEIYRVTEKFPQSEKFGLVSQMRRAAVSIPSNIAEGHERGSRKDYANFLAIARSSAAELETQTIISFNLRFLDQSEMENLLNKITEIKKMLFVLRAKLIATCNL